LSGFSQIADQQLETVVVVGKSLQHKANGYTLPIKGSGLENSQSAQEMLSFLPNISIQDNQITLLKKAPIIYVNGFKITSQDELTGLDPQRIEKIEVDYLSVGEGVSSPGGTIRITTKRERDGGFSGSLRESVTEMLHYGHIKDTPRFTFNASQGKWSLNYYAYYNHQKLLGDERNEYYYDNGNNRVYDSRLRTWTKFFSNRLNLSYEINKRMTLALSEFVSNNDVRDNQSSLIRKLTGNEESNNESETSTSATEDRIFGPEHNFTQQTVGKYIWETDDNGSTFEMTADYLTKAYYMKQKEEMTGYDPTEQHTKETTHMLRLKPTYQKAYDSGSQLTVGLNYQAVNYKDASDDLSNKMDGYSPSAFVNFAGRVKSVMYAVGLTAQHNRMVVHTEGVRTTRDDTYFCPQANVIWTINPERSTRLSVMYQREVENMPYSVINSYKNYSSYNHYTVGNPSLITPSDHQAVVSLDLDRHWSLTWMLYRIEDPIYYGHGVDEANPSITWARPENGNYEQMMYAQVEWNTKATKWWRVKASADAKQVRLSTPETSNTGKIGGSFTWNNLFNFSNTFGGSLTGYWETGISLENYSWRPVGNLSASLWKSFCKNRFLVNIESTICGRNRIATTYGDSYTSIYHNMTKPTSFSFTFTWKFKGGKKVKMREEAESIQEYYKFEETK
jgi:hypothetical protein